MPLLPETRNKLKEPSLPVRRTTTGHSNTAGCRRATSEVNGRPWRLGSESNRLFKCLLLMSFSRASSCRYPVRYAVEEPEVCGPRTVMFNVQYSSRGER